MIEKHADCEFYDLFLHEPAAVRNDISSSLSHQMHGTMHWAIICHGTSSNMLEQWRSCLQNS
jgi:hypothetical protein